MPNGFREKLCQISDTSEMLGLERAVWQQTAAKNKRPEYRRMSLAITLALAENPNPAAGEALARSAVFSEIPNVRLAAMDGLKHRPLDQYVPLLLSGLQSPIEADMRFMLSAAGDLITSYSVYQEGALSNFSARLTLAPVYPDNEPLLLTQTMCHGATQADWADVPRRLAQADFENEVKIAANQRRNAEKSAAKARQQEAALHDAVDRANRASAAAMPKSKSSSARRPDRTWATNRRNGGIGGGRITTNPTRSAPEPTRAKRVHRRSRNRTTSAW